MLRTNLQTTPRLKSDSAAFNVCWAMDMPLQDLRVIENSNAALREIAALPEQTEFSLLRAMAHLHAIKTSLKSIEAWLRAQGAIAMAAA